MAAAIVTGVFPQASERADTGNETSGGGSLKLSGQQRLQHNAMDGDDDRASSRRGGGVRDEALVRHAAVSMATRHRPLDLTETPSRGERGRRPHLF